MDKDDVFEDDTVYILRTYCTDCGRKVTLRRAEEGYGVCDDCWRDHVVIQETGDGGDAVGAGVRW